MPAYLNDGWYTPLGPRRLHDAVVDGAIDSAGQLYRAGVPPEAVMGAALQLQRQHAAQAQAPWDDQAAAQALTALLEVVAPSAPLADFIRDCWSAVHHPDDLQAFHLHLLHVRQMLALLTFTSRDAQGAPGAPDAAAGAALAAILQGPRAPKAAADKAAATRATQRASQPLAKKR